MPLLNITFERIYPCWNEIEITDKEAKELARIAHHGRNLFAWVKKHHPEALQNAVVAEDRKLTTNLERSIYRTGRLNGKSTQAA